MNLKIYYLYHSGWAVYTDGAVFIYDYYMDSSDAGQKRNISGGVISAEDIADRDIYVFASHSHGDHFNPCIFRFEKQAKSAEYILSSDIHNRRAAHYVDPGQELHLGDADIKVFGSTDAGVSFFVRYRGISMFHAGDLNLWHWKNESSEDDVRIAERDFMREITPVIKEGTPDIAFFPADPRMGSGFDAGARYYLQAVKPKYFFPMHFGGDYEAAEKFASGVKGGGVSILVPKRRGQMFEIVI